jgi:HK97 family phage major capsid protein
MDLSEIKSLIESQGKAWEQHKATNDELLKAKADGKAVGDLEAKLAKVSEEMDKLSDLKGEIDALIVKSNRPGNGQKNDDLEVECKQFNTAAKADAQGRGKSFFGDVSVDQYAAYKSGFFGMIRHGNVDRLTEDERKAMQTGNDPDGGYLLPTPTVGRIVAKMYERSVMRQLATVVSLSGNDLEGIVDNGEAVAGWVDEIGSRDDTSTPQVGKYRIEAHELYAQPKVTQRVIDDAAVDVEAWLAAKVADNFARVEGAAFTTGNGVGKPRGLFSYTTAATGDDSRAWGTFEHIKTGADGAFHTTKADPLQDLIGAMKDQYLGRAQWLMRREVRTALRKMKEATSDRYLWEPSLQAGQPDRLLGYAARVDQYVPTIGTGSLSLAFGDFAEAYTIVDRLGVRILRDPFTAKPYVRFYTTKRTGGGAINFEAVKFLKFSA